jgi:hypothetical protein
MAHIGFAIVGPFAVRIGVMHKAHEAQANTRRRPFEHLLVAVGIAKGENRTPADEFVDGPFKGLGVRGAKRGCFAIGAIEQGNGCGNASAWRAVLA